MEHNKPCLFLLKGVIACILLVCQAGRGISSLNLVMSGSKLHEEPTLLNFFSRKYIQVGNA